MPGPWPLKISPPSRSERNWNGVVFRQNLPAIYWMVDAKQFPGNIATA